MVRVEQGHRHFYGRVGGQGDLVRLVELEGVHKGVQLGEFVRQQVRGDLRAVDGPQVPAVVQAVEVVRVHVRQEVDVFRKGALLGLAEVVHHNVCVFD